MPTGNRRLASQMMNPMEISLADEVRKTLQAECYGAALALALTIPDAYGQIAFPEEKKVGKRYMDWYRQYCGYALSSRMGKDPMPALPRSRNTNSDRHMGRMWPPQRPYSASRRITGMVLEFPTKDSSLSRPPSNSCRCRKDRRQSRILHSKAEVLCSQRSRRGRRPHTLRLSHSSAND